MWKVPTFVLVGCLAVCSVAGAQTAPAPSPAAQQGTVVSQTLEGRGGQGVLTEVQRLKAENLRLRFALLQQQQRDIEQAGTKLQEEAKTLEVEFRQTLKPSPEQTFNWTTLAFDGKPTAASTNGAAPSSTAAKPPGE
jgi:methionine-rich copper-binding protein CopC